MCAVNILEGKQTKEAFVNLKESRVFNPKSKYLHGIADYLHVDVKAFLMVLIQIF